MVVPCQVGISLIRKFCLSRRPRSRRGLHRPDVGSPSPALKALARPVPNGHLCPMSLESRLNDWVEAGLIDLATAERIRAHESANERPVLRWALAGLGLFAVVLGIILLISANWDRIPHGVKLAAHMALLLGAAAAHWHWKQQRKLWPAEGALFLFAGLVLAGIGLQSQVYQLTGPVWHALLLWLLLAGPALLLSGETRLTGTGFAGLALVGPAAMALDSIDKGGPWLIAQGTAMAVPALLIALSLSLRERGPGFRLALREAGIVSLLAGAGIVHFAWASNITGAQAADNAVRLIPAALACLGTLALGWNRPEIPRAILLPLLIGPPAAFALALAIPHPDGMASRLIGIAIYMALWSALARGAALSGWNSLFAVSIAAIALRIFIIYIELFGSLAATGGGLVIGGLLLVGLSWLWHRIVTRRQSA
ncbi:DUF2157 domain-containing protein [Sandaracinobacter neustonicus]|uniref:DUF2157 domain-containing protein n=2 Tax=Sandaracinobacter neustonicus TaxID=1715348 RepID=A0A501XHU7_9SPHN|nr:DUF2157 domain-containing protein [Sandaracinobacter neustonicus]